MFKDFILPGWNPMPKCERIVIDNAPRFMRGLRIAFATDFHIRDCTTDAYIASLAALLQNTGADLLLMGGDYGESTQASDRLFEALSGLTFPYGIYGSIGNNDVECFENAANLRAVMPFPLLVNEKLTLRINGGTLYIGGADELKYGEARVSGLFPRNSAPSYSILISHHPWMHDFTSGARPRLMLSGHTHGGQINLWGINCYSMKLVREKVQKVEGLFDMGETKLLVSPGIGVSRWPIRVGCPPKIHVIEFRQ